MKVRYRILQSRWPDGGDWENWGFFYERDKRESGEARLVCHHNLDEFHWVIHKVNESICSEGLSLRSAQKAVAACGEGYRVLDKYAVRVGGGVNHRMSLYDMLLVKDNHVDGAGGLAPAVERARAAYPDLPIEVEVRNLDELRQALDLTPPLDRILLDNLSPETMRQAVALAAGRVSLEASGGVTLERAAEIAATGVDYISVGALTHSAPALDINMKVVTAGIYDALNLFS